MGNSQRYLLALAISSSISGAACGQAALPVSEVPAPARHVDGAGSAEGLEYAVGNGSWRPASSAPDGGARFAIGEAQPGPNTLLLASFNADLEPEVGLLVEPGSSESVVGQLGGGQLVRGGVEYEFARELGASGSFSFWVRPEPADSGSLLEVPGLLRLDLRPGLRVAAQLQTVPSEEDVAPERRCMSGARLAADEWNFVAVTWDLEEFETLRLQVGDSTARDWQAAGRPDVAGTRVILGSPIADLEFDDLHATARFVSTSELLQLLEPPHPSPERLVRVRSNSGPELELRPFLDVVAQASAPLEALHAGRRDHLRRTDRGLEWCEAQWRQDFPLEPPMPRTTHAQAFVGDHRVWMFSGEVRDTFGGKMHNPEDVWEYDLVACEWERLDDPQAASGAGPMGRCHQAAAYLPELDLVILPGGWTNCQKRTNGLHEDLWGFDRKTRTWRELHPKRKPDGGSDSPFVRRPAQQDFVLIRGWQTLRYAPGNGGWKRVGKLPTALDFEPLGKFGSGVPVPLSTTAAYDPEFDRVVLTGGERVDRSGEQQHEYFDFVRLIDVDGRSQRVIRPRPAPSPRARSAFEYHPPSKRLVLFGGTQNQFSDRMGDLWTLDLETESWTEHAQADAPDPRGGLYDLSYDPELDEFALICGRRAFMHFTNDVFRLRMDSEAPGRLELVFDRAALEPGLDHVQIAYTGGEAPAIEFAGSDDNLTWGDASPTAAEVLEPATRFVRVILRTPAEPGYRISGVSLVSAAESDEGRLVTPLTAR